MLSQLRVRFCQGKLTFVGKICQNAYCQFKARYSYFEFKDLNRYQSLSKFVSWSAMVPEIPELSVAFGSSTSAPRSSVP